MRQSLIRCLDAGQTGCISATADTGAGLAVYVMFGEILAAHSSDDDLQMLRVLHHRGEVTEARMQALIKRSEGGESLSEILFDEVKDESLMQVLNARFRENLFDFLGVSREPSFEAMDGIFVENIQVGHDSRQLIAELAELRAGVASLLAQPTLVLAPGAVVPRGAEEQRIVASATPRVALGELLVRSPWEPSATLERVAGLLERGCLIGTPAPSRAPARPPNPDAITGPKPIIQRSPAAPAKPPAPIVAPTPAPKPPPPVAKPVPPVAKPAPPVAKPPPAVTPAVSPVKPPPAMDAKRTIEPRPSSVQKPSGPAEVEEDLFADHDHDRGDGSFSTAKDLLDRVEILPPTPGIRASARPAPPPPGGPVETIEMEDAESAPREALAGAVSLNFAGPRLSDDEARKKLDVVNEVLATLAAALDALEGHGMGQARAQLLVEGTPGAFAALFKNVEVDDTGQLPAEAVLKNLRKRPASEHRRLLNRGLGDLIDRALSLAGESLDDAALEAMLEKIAGYQQRIGV